MRTARRWIIILGVIASLVAGCERTRALPVSTRPEPVRLSVRNDHFSDVTIYAFNGSRQRIGIVTGLSSSSFVLPDEAMRSGVGFRLEADPIGSIDAYVTSIIVASPGDEIVLQVAPVLGMSHWYMRQ
ncbi:MAG: hypothetical protein HY701_14460 [Gemmatimonadetes bacterium]|nr:hypothetical protein [Gemmatimonadota bacterium]